MEHKHEAPAKDWQGAQNLTKYTDFPADIQKPEGLFSELTEDIKHNETKLKTQRKQQEKGKSYQSVLSELLNQLQPINYRELAELENEEKLTRKNYVVISIDNIIEVAKSNNWGICTQNGFIYVFNGKYWQSLSNDDLKSFLGNAAIKMQVPKLEAKYHLFRDDLFKQFMTTSIFPTPDTKQETLINLLNGTYEITESGFQNLREHKREDFLTYLLPFAYNPDAKCPLFLKYLNRVIPDKQCQMVLAEYIGYIFTKNLKLEKALILYGNGANGKSVFFEIINALLGKQNISSYSLQNLTKSDSYQRAELQNKLLNYASEINGKLEASIYKQLVSGEPVDARHIYGKPFTMSNYAKLMFNCNELPKDIEFTHAFFRRFLIIPFNQTIPESEQDPELAKKIIETELDGFFIWVLEGLKRILKQRKFTQSNLITEQIINYRKEADSVSMFLEEENYQPSNGYPNMYLKAIYSEYRAFCQDNGYRTCSNRTLSERLRNLGYTIEKNRDGRIVFAEK